MFLASSPSPTVSGTTSSFRSLSYHASSRRSFPPNSPSSRHSHAPQSPRFHTPSVSASRRADVPTAPVPERESGERPIKRKQSQPSPRSTVDVGTQYTPPEYPPTYRPFPNLKSDAERGERKGQVIGETVLQRSSSAAVTAVNTEEPSETESRVDPQVQPPKNNEARSLTIDTAPAELFLRSAVSSLGPQTSPPKKSRQQEPDLKIMPIKYETCDVKELGVLISDMLMELVRLNDKIPLKDGQLTRFHSRAPPGISVRDYLHRLIVHATLSPPILLSMVYYVDRLCALYPAFTISSLTVHRFLITAATVAAKGLSDSFWTNSTYARVGGVSTKELALLELEFLRRLEWRIVPKPEALVDYYRGLVERGGGYSLEELAPEGDNQKVTT